MELKWTSKALSDLARLYEFLAPVNKPAAARAVQALTKASTILLTNPRIGEQLFQFERAARGTANSGRGVRGSLRTSGFDHLHAAAVAYPRGPLKWLYHQLTMTSCASCALSWLRWGAGRSEFAERPQPSTGHS
jgi:plasmid stabilization system protein ParE